MESRVAPLHTVFQLNTRLFLNCFEDVTDELARTRPTQTTNSMAYIALHLHDARHYLARYLGVDEPDPFAAITAEATGIDSIDVYPSVAELRTAWMEIAMALENQFPRLDAKVLDQPSPEDAPAFPVGDRTVLGGVAFLMQHESYHVGQLAFLRKSLGLPAMSWHT